MIKILLLTVFGAWVSHAQGLIISEIFANGLATSDQGQEWFEVFNATTESIDLKDMTVRRLDGTALEEGFRFKISAHDHIWVPPGEYFVVAQTRDLGSGLCLNIPHVVVREPTFVLQNSGLQSLCIKPVNQPEDCAQFSNSKTFPKGHSRFFSGNTLKGNDALANWQVEDCSFFFGNHATPGKAAQQCGMNLISNYTDLLVHCPWNLAEIGKGPTHSLANPKTHPFPPIDKLSFEWIDETRASISLPPDLLTVGERALVEFYFTRTSTNTVGTLIPHSAKAGSTNTFLIDTSSHAPGRYFYFAQVSDGISEPSVSEPMGPIEIRRTQKLVDFSLVSAREDKEQQGILVSWTQSLNEGRVSFYWQDHANESHLITLSVLGNMGPNQFLWRPKNELKSIRTIKGIFHHASGTTQAELAFTP